MNILDRIQLFLLGWYDTPEHPELYYFKCKKHGIVNVHMKDAYCYQNVSGSYIVLDCPKCKEVTENVL